MLRLWNNVTGRGQAPAGSGRVSALVCAGMVLALGIAPSAQAVQSSVWTAAPPAVTNVNRNGYNSGAYKWSSPLPWNVDVSKCPSNDFEFRWGAVKLALMDNAEFIAHRNRADKCDKYDWYAEGSNAFITDSNSACSYPKGSNFLGALRNWQNEFNNACLQHDFAFYNLGGRTGGKFPPYQGVAPYNNYRELAERHFRQNMDNRCAGVTDRFGPNSQANCYDTARLVSYFTSNFGGKASFDKSVQDRSGNLASLANATGPQFTGFPRMFDIEVRNDGTNSETWIAQVQTNGDLLTRRVRKNSSIMEIWPQSYPGGWKNVDIEISPFGDLWLMGLRNDGQILMRTKLWAYSATAWSPWYSQGFNWLAGDIAIGPNGELWFVGTRKSSGSTYAALASRKKDFTLAVNTGWSQLTDYSSIRHFPALGTADIEVVPQNGEPFIVYKDIRNMIQIMTRDPNRTGGMKYSRVLPEGNWVHVQGETRTGFSGADRAWITASRGSSSPTYHGAFDLRNGTFSGWSVPPQGIFWPPNLND